MGAISMLSRYVHFVKLRDGRYAVYNNLMMDVLYVKKYSLKDNKRTLEILKPSQYDSFELKSEGQKYW